MKQCRKCGVAKDYERFPRKKRSIDGRDTWCKQCHKTYKDRHYKENPERYKEYVRRFRERQKGQKGTRP